MALTLVIIASVLVLGLASVWMLFGKRGRLLRQKYEALFSDAHVFGELPQLLASLKSAALARAGTPLEGPTDPRLGETSKGLSVLYTVEESRDRLLLLNHISLSYRGGPIAFAFGGSCAHLLLVQMGIDPDRAAIAHSRGGVLHIAFLIPSADRVDFFQRAPTVPSPEGIPLVKARAAEWRDGWLRSHRVLHDERELVPQLCAT